MRYYYYLVRVPETDSVPQGDYIRVSHKLVEEFLKAFEGANNHV